MEDELFLPKMPLRKKSHWQSSADANLLVAGVFPLIAKV
jgi:hypothetical protein